MNDPLIEYCLKNDDLGDPLISREHIYAFNWAKKNGVETFLALQTPHFQHGDFNNPPSYDFVEFMAAPFETHGKGWDKLTETKEGQDILNEWGEVSTCYMKMNSAYFNYANEEALNEGDSRYAEWNWCSIRDGKSPDDLIAFHNKAAARMEENPNGAIGWLTMVFSGMLPYIFTNTIDNIPDLIFETMSGYTTTGSSIIGDIEALPESIIFWRSMTHWLGGMGIIVLAIAILPMLGIGGCLLYTSPSPRDRTRSRMPSSA